MRKSVLIVLLFIVACTGSTIVQLEGSRERLYNVKQEWLSVREYVIINHALGAMSDEDYSKFRDTDAVFSYWYAKAVDVLYNEPNNVNFDNILDTLKQIVIIEGAKYRAAKKGG
jgi:hypothetical protein